MAKASPDATLDALHAKIATATRMTVCSGQPANFAGIAAVLLASVTQTAGLGGAHYTSAAGDTSGRKVTMTQRTFVGPATHAGGR